ncbi:hypothetical protein A2U01_0040376, partial [Trifolium medium]|nr:hypothetical protein [Trifolium medium]
MPATVTRLPSAVAIFLLLGQGEYVENCLEEGAMWSVAPESNIQNSLEAVSETLNPNESGSLPEYAATVQVPDKARYRFVRFLAMNFSYVDDHSSYLA